MDAKNLLVIMADEHNAQAMGCAGHETVRTPHLDALAARGTRFTSAYTNSPICVPARAAFHTGQYVYKAGYWDNSFGYDGRIDSWGHALRRAGSRVESIGKLHFQNGMFDTGFDKQHIPMHLANGTGMVQGSIRGQFPNFNPGKKLTPGNVGILARIGAGESNYTHYDRKISRLASEWLDHASRDAGGKPWCLFVSFVTPHYPLIAPEEYVSHYMKQDFPLPPYTDHSAYPPHRWWASKADSPAHITPEHIRLAVASYYALCSFMDEMTGAVLKTLEASGMMDSTRIIYSSDHGECLGKRGLWGKSVMYREATQVPLILAGEGVSEGARCATPVSLVDAYPSILQATGAHAQAQADLPGLSWFDTASEPDSERFVFSEYHAMGSPSAAYMLCDGRYKLHHYAGGYEQELFDLGSDPDEVCNLAASSAHRPVLERLGRQLRMMLDPETVDGEAKDAQKRLVEKHGGPAAVVEKFGTGGKAYTDVPAELLA
ncbi:MAG: sulfatase [Alphaproteobacteria bacterium]|nr:sulfatase [Alphaproteobacteria bacterium]